MEEPTARAGPGRAAHDRGDGTTASPATATTPPPAGEDEDGTTTSTATARTSPSAGEDEDGTTASGTTARTSPATEGGGTTASTTTARTSPAAGGGGTTARPATAATSPAAGGSGRLRRLGRDYAYVLPGLPLAVASLAVLVALTAASLGTLVIWVGAVLTPVTLLIASAFAGMSRRRLRRWGADPAPVTYPPVGRGLRALLRVLLQPRRWMDLAFEGLIAFPLRLITFVLAVIWSAVALGGVTFWVWWQFVPTDDSWPVRVLTWAGSEVLPLTDRAVYLLDSGVYLAIGILCLVTLPALLRGLARLDALVTETLLTSGRLQASESVRWAWTGATYAAVVLVVVGWPVLATVHGVHPAVAMVLTVGHSLSLVLAVRWAGLATALSSLVVAGTMLTTAGVAAQVPWPWPVTSIITQCLLMVALALGHWWIWTVAAWSLSALLTTGALLLVPDGLPSGALSNSVVLVSVTAALALLGILGRLWRQGTARAVQAEEHSAEETQRRRDLEERNRIARELHDVVAHSMSVINVQASTARYRKPGIDDDVQQEFDDIARSSHRALSEMRELLALLRDDDDAPTAPVPTLTDIPDLVDAARASGATITHTIDEAEVPATVGLTAYRIVQEAISNALRYAPGASIEVRAARGDDGGQLRVAVVNSAPQDTGDGQTAVPGSGLGLAGVRERVTALGGTVQAAPTAGGGFELDAMLPLEAGPEERA